MPVSITSKCFLPQRIFFFSEPFKSLIFSVPLVSCHSGESGEVSHIKTEDARKLRKIMNLGLIPGSKISLIQKFPNYVFQLGNTQLAVDKELANEIFIKLDG